MTKILFWMLFISLNDTPYLSPWVDDTLYRSKSHCVTVGKWYEDNYPPSDRTIKTTCMACRKGEVCEGLLNDRKKKNKR